MHFAFISTVHQTKVLLIPVPDRCSPEVVSPCKWCFTACYTTASTTVPRFYHRGHHTLEYERAVYCRAFILPDRQIVLDKVEDEEDEQRHTKVHNSLTTDGVSMPVIAKGNRAIPLSRKPLRKQPTEVIWGTYCFVTVVDADDTATFAVVSKKSRKQHVGQASDGKTT